MWDWSALAFMLCGLATAANEPGTGGIPSAPVDATTIRHKVMCGYQGWFRAEGDGSGEGWSHYSERGPLTSANLHPDFWPDVSEYEKTYPTSLLNKDGTTVRVFSSWDQSTTAEPSMPKPKCSTWPCLTRWMRARPS